jgi:hypothetical protein
MAVVIWHVCYENIKHAVQLTAARTPPPWRHTRLSSLRLPPRMAAIYTHKKVS